MSRHTGHVSWIDDSEQERAKETQDRAIKKESVFVAGHDHDMNLSTSQDMTRLTRALMITCWF